MFRNRVLVVASALVLGACISDQSGPTGPVGTGFTPPFASSVVELTGTLVASGEDYAPVSLCCALQGGLIPLGGNQAILMAGLDGAEVWVRGTWDASPGLIVASFRVLAVDGRAALDGILVQTDSADYALQLADGTVRTLVDPPAELTAEVGARVWVTGGTDDPPVRFGVIERRY